MSLWVILHIYVHVCRCESAYVTIQHIERERQIDWHRKKRKSGKEREKSKSIKLGLGLQNASTAFLQRSKTLYPNECPGYETKQSDGEAPVTQELWWLWSTSSLPSHPAPLLWLGVVVLDRVLSMTQMKLNCVLMQNWIAWNRTVWTFKISTSFKLHTYAKLNCLKVELFWHLNFILMLNRIARNRTALIFELPTYAKLNFLK